MDDVVERVRAFNRGWTELLGLLDQGLLDTSYTLTEARVIFELAQGQHERADLRERLGMDASFLSRVLGGLERQGLVSTAPSPRDGRALTVALTSAGAAVAEDLRLRSVQQVSALLESLAGHERDDLAASLALVDQLLRPSYADRTVTLRDLRPGDLGWIVERHGAVYAGEQGWGDDFEGLVATVVADFQAHRDPVRERGWIAEVGGVRAGSILCCRRDEDTAQLRVLLVERWARGLSVGRRLVEACVAFAREQGYTSMVLWTDGTLAPARALYESVGFTLVEERPNDDFGEGLVAQVWSLDLRS